MDDTGKLIPNLLTYQMICEAAGKLPISVRWAGCAGWTVLFGAPTARDASVETNKNSAGAVRLCARLSTAFRGERNWLSLICIEKFISDLVNYPEKSCGAKYTCQLIRLRLEVQGDPLMLSSTKSAAFLLPPGVLRAGTEGNWFMLWKCCCA